MKNKVVRELLILIGGFILLFISYTIIDSIRNAPFDLLDNTRQAIFVIVFIRISLWLIRWSGHSNNSKSTTSKKPN